ncbi:MAG: hypothetical protein SO016_00395 [Lachnospiraceae bacterium]|nr:hypothetical protein [Lachnospiraceae bacterium]
MKTISNITKITNEWKALAGKDSESSGKIYSLLPTPFFFGSSLSETEEAAWQLCSVLKEGKVMRFVADGLPLIYFRMKHCDKKDVRFTELRYLAEMLEDVSGYRGRYKGCLLLDLTDWIGHEDENYFEILMSYLADIKDEEIFTFFCVEEKMVSQNQEEEGIEEILRQELSHRHKKRLTLEEELDEED